MLTMLALATAVAGAPPLAQSSCPSAAALFTDVRAHTGGARWNFAKELIADGIVTAVGLTGRCSRWHDGRWARRCASRSRRTRTSAT